MREEVLEEAGKGDHGLSGVFSNKTKKKGVFSVSRAGFGCIYNRGSVGGEGRVVVGKGGDLRVVRMRWWHHRQRAKKQLLPKRAKFLARFF